MVVPTGATGFRAAVGCIGSGLDGFRSTHRQAVEAARVAQLSRDTEKDAVVPFDQVNLLALLTTDVSGVREFIRHELGALAEEGLRFRTLRDTVLIYLECRRSLSAAAERLYVARNTVTYRLRRAEELIGHNLDTRDWEVRTALKAAAVLGIGGE